ncbi:hypothetical protein ACF1BE_18790 [Streptomyces sp. NPDC014991]|uniref:hypothetical protein n=1 Tax=Streptomyces sp. NPDC014991 TaxID=3364935 RepID=UPI0036FBE748
MQDGEARLVRAAEAGEQLCELVKDAPDPKVDILWRVTPSPRPAQRARLLEILFGEDASA